jgi:hypothetical protein
MWVLLAILLIGDQGGTQRQVREKRIAAMKKHCTAIIRDSKRLAGDYRAMAKWHRITAADLNDEE